MLRKGLTLQVKQKETFPAKKRWLFQWSTIIKKNCYIFFIIIIINNSLLWNNKINFLSFSLDVMLQFFLFFFFVSLLCRRIINIICGSIVCRGHEWPSIFFVSKKLLAAVLDCVSLDRFFSLFAFVFRFCFTSFCVHIQFCALFVSVNFRIEKKMPNVPDETKMKRLDNDLIVCWPVIIVVVVIIIVD